MRSCAATPWLLTHAARGLLAPYHRHYFIGFLSLGESLSFRHLLWLRKLHVQADSVFGRGLSVDG